MEMDWRLLLGGVTLTTIIASFFGQIKGFFVSCLGLLIITIKLEDSYDVKCLLIQLLNKKYKRIKLHTKEISHSYENLRNLGKRSYVFFESIPNLPLIVFRKGIFPLFVGKINVEGKGPSSNSLTFIRGTFNIEELITDLYKFAYDFHKNEAVKKESRYRIKKLFGNLSNLLAGKSSNSKDEDSSPQDATVSDDVSDWRGRRLIGTTLDNIGENISKDDPFKYIALTPDCIEVLREVKAWLNREEWFRERRLPWNMGQMWIGPPGTGKTTFARALAEKNNLPVFVYDLTTMSNADLVEKWKVAQRNSPCIALFEDIDTVFNKRENATKNTMQSYLTFDCLLNILDGIERNNGILTIITTNRPEKLDEALCDIKDGVIKTRPGRIDRVLHFTNLDEKGKKKVAGNILKGYSEIQEEVCRSTQQSVTGAEFQRICIDRAREIYYKEIQNKVN